MAAINQDFEMFAGEDKQLKFTVTDESGAPVVLAGSSATWIMANILSSPVVKITKTTVGGKITITSNVFNVFIDSEDTINRNGRYRHEIRMVNEGGKETVVAVGEVVVHSSLTYTEPVPIV